MPTAAAPRSPKKVTQLMADLGVTKTHSRPHVQHDNPFSEAQFKTVKYYRPDYPDPLRLSRWMPERGAKPFFAWYNGLPSPHGLGAIDASGYSWGRAEVVRRERQRVLEAASATHPERFVKASLVAEPPKAVWINPPAASDTSVSEPISPSCPLGLEDAIPMLP
ncbi:MAG: hypothetical protein U0641_09200 [Anaerolineae bacterium]